MYNHILLPIALDHNPEKGQAMQVAQTLLSDGGKITVFNVVEVWPGYVDAHVPIEVRDHQIEEVGAHLRSQMAWLDPVEVRAGQAQASAGGPTQSKGEATEGAMS